MANPRMFDDLIDAASRFANDRSPLDRAMPSPGRAAMPPLAPATPAGMFDDLLPSPLDRAMPGVPGAARTQSGGMPWLEYIDNLGRQSASGMALGGMDEASAGLNAVLGTSFGTGDTFGKGVQHKPGATMGERYDADLAFNRERDKAFLAQYPIAGTAANVAGAIGGTYGPLKALGLLKPAAGFWGNVGKNMAAGALVGGPAGVLNAEGGFDKRLVAGEIGAGLGAGVGAAAVPVMGIVGTGASALAQSPFGQAAGQVIGSGLNKAAAAIESFAPRVQPRSLSAGAVPGRPGVIQDGAATNIAEILRAQAMRASNTVEAGAYDRLAMAVMKAKIDPAAAPAAMAALGQGTPADLSHRLSALAKDSFVGAPGVRDAAEATKKLRDAGIAPQLVEAFEGANRPPTMGETTRFADAYARRVGHNLYDRLREVPPEVSPRMTQMLRDTPALQTAAARIEADAVKYNTRLTDYDRFATLKRQMQDDAIASARGTDSVNMGKVKKLSKDWKQAWHDANPWVREADAMYQKQVIEPFGAARDRVTRDGRPKTAGLLDDGANFLRVNQREGFSPDEFARKISAASPEGVLAARVGAVNEMRDSAFAGADQTRALAKRIDAAVPVPSRDNVNLGNTINTIFGADRGEAIRAAAAAIRKKGEVDRLITGGSETAKNLIEAGNLPALAAPQGRSVMDVALGIYNAAASRARAGNEASREAMMPLVYNTDPVVNAQTMERLAAIIARARTPGSTITPAAAPLYGAVGSEFGPRY